MPPTEAIEAPLPPEALPWYAEYGSLIALVMVATIMVLAAVTARLRVRWVGSKDAQRVRAQLGAPTPPGAYEHGASATLEGELVVVSEPCRRFEDGVAAAATTLERSAQGHRFEPPEAPVSLTAAAGELSLEVDGERVDIEKPVRVWIGARQWWAPGGTETLAGEVDQRIREQTGAEPEDLPAGEHCLLRSLHHGDRVVARGVLERSPRSGAQRNGYRRSAAGFTLRPIRGATQLAFAGAPQPRGRLARVSKRAALLGLVVALASLYGWGEYFLHRESAWASLSPFLRERALALHHLDSERRLNEMREALEQTPPAGRAHVERLLTLYQRLEDCPAEGAVLARMGQLRAAAERFEACPIGTKSLAVRALLRLGDFEGASEMAERMPREGCDHIVIAIRAHLLAGRKESAADRLDVYARCVANEKHNTTSAHEHIAKCMAATLRGDEPTIESQNETVQDECRLLRADATRGETRAEALARLRRRRYEAYLLAREDDLSPWPDEGFRGSHLAFDHRLEAPLERLLETTKSRPYGLLLAAARADGREPSRLSLQVRVEAIGFELLAGEPERALGLTRRYGDALAAWSGQGRAHRSTDPMVVRYQRPALQALIALRRGDAGAVPRLLDQAPRPAVGERWRTTVGATLAYDLHRSDRALRQLRHLAEFAETGRTAGVVADLAEEPKSFYGTLNPVEAFEASGEAPDPGVFERSCEEVTCGATALVPLLLASRRLAADDPDRWLEVLRAVASPHDDALPGSAEIMRRAALTAAIAARLGDPELAARHRMIARRYRTALLRRDTSLPLSWFE